MDLDTLLCLIESGQIVLSEGDAISVCLRRNEPDVDFVVTYQDESKIRFESRDSIGYYFTGINFDWFIKTMDEMLPDALRRHIIETERFYEVDGVQTGKKVKLFLPAASEIFAPEDNLSGEKLYRQLDWYKTPNHRSRLSFKNSPHNQPYWTESTSALCDNSNVVVDSCGNADFCEWGRALPAPICFCIQKTGNMIRTLKEECERKEKQLQEAKETLEHIMASQKLCALCANESCKNSATGKVGCAPVWSGRTPWNG